MNYYYMSREYEHLTYERDSLGDKLIENMVMSDGKYFFPPKLTKVKSFNEIELSKLVKEALYKLERRDLIWNKNQ